MIALWGRLKDGNKVGENMQLMLSKSTLKNLLDDHPPFQIDGNFGGTAAIAEALMQSHDGTIELLPALPDIWPEGEINGIRARGGYTLSIAWAGGRLTRAVIESGRDADLSVAYAGNTLSKRLIKGESIELMAADFS